MLTTPKRAESFARFKVGAKFVRKGAGSTLAEHTFLPLLFFLALMLYIINLLPLQYTTGRLLVYEEYVAFRSSKHFIFALLWRLNFARL